MLYKQITRSNVNIHVSSNSSHNFYSIPLLLAAIIYRLYTNNTRVVFILLYTYNTRVVFILLYTYKLHV